MNGVNIRKIPRPGLRNIKTAIAIILCVLLYQTIERSGVLLAAIAALICMQDSVEKSIKEGANRMIGTTLGGMLGVAFVYSPFFKLNFYLWIGMIFLGIIILIYCCNLFRIRDSIIIGCVVFLIIMLEAETYYQSPFIYALNRILDTFIGIIFAALVNYFLFRPQPERVAGEIQPIELEYAIAKAGKQKVSDWSGGTTTELFIYPEDCLYGDREFEWRISTSKVLLRSSVFTKLPGYMKRTMVLEGRMSIDHHDHHRILLDPFDQDYFDGEWTTKSYGRGTDFNLTLQQGQEGKIDSVKANTDYLFDSSLFTSFYILEDEITLTIASETEKLVVENFGKHDFILFYPFLEEIRTPLTFRLENREKTSEDIIAVQTVVFPTTV